MKPGEAIRVKRVKAFFHGEKVRGDVDFVAPPGKYFVLLFCGVETAGSYDIAPGDFLRAGGWRHSSDKPKAKRKPRKKA